jgi:hypothetical protein
MWCCVFWYKSTNISRNLCHAVKQCTNTWKWGQNVGLYIYIYILMCVCVCIYIYVVPSFGAEPCVFSLQSKHVKLKVCKTIYRTWPPALWEEHRLRVFKNRVLRTIFEPKRNELTEESSYITRSFMICTAPQIFR